MSIPGYAAGRYDGSTHGPTTAQWALWNGTQNIRRDEVDAGDIIVWVGHMGIAISNDQMISALNPRTTTKIGSIDGFKGVPVRYGRFL
jgi:cell wall-associated NlpC family hydrolase